LYATGQAADPFAGAALSTRELVLQDVGRLSITLTASLDFTQIGAVRLSTEDDSGARVRWTMDQVVQRAGMTIEDAQSLGALLDVGLSWDCPMLSTECLPVLKVQQLAAGLPFYTQWASYYRQDTSDDEYRDLYQARGIRLVVSSYGIGTAIGIEEIVIQLFVLLALLPIASGLADTIMQYLFSERRHYREYKTEQSPDFSDVRAKVEQLEKEGQSRQAKSLSYA